MKSNKFLIFVSLIVVLLMASTFSVNAQPPTPVYKLTCSSFSLEISGWMSLTSIHIQILNVTQDYKTLVDKSFRVVNGKASAMVTFPLQPQTDTLAVSVRGGGGGRGPANVFNMNGPCGSVPPSISRAQKGEGEIDIPVYCREKGYPHAIYQEENAYSWECKNDAGQTVVLDFFAACKEVYGSERQYPALDDPRDPFNWLCMTNKSHVAPKATRPLQRYSIDLGDNVIVPIVFDIEIFGIRNGAEILAAEISRFEKVLKNSSRPVRVARFVKYFAESVVSVIRGDVERLRLRITEIVCQTTELTDPCVIRLRYKVGKRYMDMSGLGNVSFGYFMASSVVSSHIEDIISDVAQKFNHETREEVNAICGGELYCKLTRFFALGDFSDDKIQRAVGRRLAERVKDNQVLSVQLIEDIAKELGLQ